MQHTIYVRVSHIVFVFNSKVFEVLKTGAKCIFPASYSSLKRSTTLSDIPILHVMNKGKPSLTVMLFCSQVYPIVLNALQ